MIDQIIQLLMQSQQGDRTIPVPNDFGAGGIMHMPIPQPSPFNQSMRPPMQEGPAPPVSARDIMSLLGGNRGSGIASR